MNLEEYYTNYKSEVYNLKDLALKACQEGDREAIAKYDDAIYETIFEHHRLMSDKCLEIRVVLSKIEDPIAKSKLLEVEKFFVTDRNVTAEALNNYAREIVNSEFEQD